MQKWLARQSVSASILNLVGGALFAILGLVALLLTSCAAAAAAFFVLMGFNAARAFFGFAIAPPNLNLFGILVLLFLALSLVHAYWTRADADAPAKFDLTVGFGLFWELISAGPIMIIMSGQEFHRFLRLVRMDVSQVSTLLLWIYDKGGRASFAEICLAFPGLNAVRVLPQLRDLSGIHWWPDDGEVSFSEDLLKTLAETLGREPKSSPFARGHTRERRTYQKPVAGIDQDIRSWYATLSLPLFANLQDVKRRYRKLAKIHHPDVQSANKAANDDEMKRINEAYHNILRYSQSTAGATQ